METISRRALSAAGELAFSVGLPPSILGVLSAKFAHRGQATLIPADEGFDPVWVASLPARGRPDLSRGENLKWIGMPVGGLCCGQVYLSGRGQLWHWDIFHQRGGGDTQGTHCAKPMPVQSPIRQGFALTVDGVRYALGELAGEGEAPEAEFENRYPIGIVRYRTPGVSIDLCAGSPFVPPETDDSSLPIVVGTGRGSFELSDRELTLQVRHGGSTIRSIGLPGRITGVALGGKAVSGRERTDKGRTWGEFARDTRLRGGNVLSVSRGN